MTIFKLKELYPKALCSWNLAEPPPPELSKRGIASAVPFYADVKVMLPLMVATVALVVAVVIVGLRWRSSKLFIVNFYQLTNSTFNIWMVYLHRSSLCIFHDIRKIILKSLNLEKWIPCKESGCFINYKFKPYMNKINYCDIWLSIFYNNVSSCI